MRHGNQGCSVVRTLAIALATAAVTLVVASPASATTTIGSDLSPAPNAGSGCSTQPCTDSILVLPGRLVSSPIDGVVVRWRVEWTQGGGADKARLRIHRPLGGPSLFKSSSATMPLVHGFNIFATRLPIEAGDRIAVDNVSGNGHLLGLAAQSGAGQERWDTAPPDGWVVSPNATGVFNTEHYMNADVEADLDCDGFGDETQDPSVSGGCLPSPVGATNPPVDASKPPLAGAADLLGAKVKGKKLVLRLRCAATAGCAGNEIVVRTKKKVDLNRFAAAAKRRRVLLARGDAFLAAGETATVRLKLRKQGRKLFRARKKVRAKAAITAPAGTASSTLKIKRK